MAYSYFGMALQQLNQIGLLDIILPFILIFTIIFAVLQRTKILGKDDDNKPYKNFNVVIALVMGLAAVIPHVLWGSPSMSRTCVLGNGLIDVVCTINNALPNVSLIVVGVMMLLIIIGIWGKNIDIGGTTLGGLVTILSIVAIIAIFAVAAGWMGNLPRWLYFLRDAQTQALFIVIIVFGLIIRFITGPGEKKNKDEKSALGKLGEALKDSYTGK